ncbi:Heavy metal tolerance protein [Cyphellophora attinorum]|uniref:Heavy metal tolerance protein n=1 Tax=Cyphellophora attinorum TaxID=1664694 RepID=A0A0N1NZC2_9EURO|nr:Heavy metal tolerance protein [Phialophora attinorum]KPI37130.1 Heavy metal tolerance protein [Phialophora attinorum]
MGGSSPLPMDIAMDTSYRIMNWSRKLYPAILLVLFIAGFVTYGIVNAPDDSSNVQIHSMKGPGGRPLPQRRKSANQVKQAAAVKDFSSAAKISFKLLQTVVVSTFVANGVFILLQCLAEREKRWWPGEASIIYVVGSFFVWSIVLISLHETKPSPTIVFLLVWLISLPLELLILGSSLKIYSVPHHEPTVGDQRGGPLRDKITPWEAIEVIVGFIRIGGLLGMSILYIIFSLTSNKTGDSDGSSSETAPLLNGGSDSAHTHTNGNAYGTPQAQESKEHQAGWAKSADPPTVTWYQYLRGFATLLPYLWPKKSLKLQALAAGCFLIMISQRVINVFVPIMTERITDALSGEDGQGVRAPWLYIALYVVFRWLQGGQGILSAARTIMWIPVEQYSYRAISTTAFEHVHGLSAEFHTGKRTGELISALNKGTSINSFLELVTFSVGPMIFDLVVAIVYLTLTFDIYLGLVVAITTVAYIYVTIRLASWRVKLRREYVAKDREMEAVKNDSLHSWDTVKYFNAEAYEFERYRVSIKEMQGCEYYVQLTLSFMNTIQGALFLFALLIACFIEAYQVAEGSQTVGRFVLLITYMSQLQQPLNYFGSYYRTVQNNLINAERMLELFKEQPIVTDKATATPMEKCKGELSFDKVTFSYDGRRDAVANLSFHCPAGTTTALVGESGGGKSTVMRLLYRYYNPSSGSLSVDGLNVEDVTIDSLRRHIGVVPQDCNMFNESLMYNLKYANQDATDEEIFKACKAASIHDRIMAFPDGYATKVGERGVRLSGGERQRVAIARTFLKNPRITLLDEATAALDTDTEEKIQESFAQLAEGRTMLIIAHRLSTIINADQILVLHNGSVVERGTHDELLATPGGRYASMWRKQSRAQKAKEEAEQLHNQARRKIEEAEAESASVSEDESDMHAGASRRTAASRNSSRPGSSRGQRAPGQKYGHKKVNFSQSSLARGVWNATEGDVEAQSENDSDPASTQALAPVNGNIPNGQQDRSGASSPGRTPQPPAERSEEEKRRREEMRRAYQANQTDEGGSKWLGGMPPGHP